MVYRDFGNTGLKISQLGFGCMRLPEQEAGGETRVDDEKAIPVLRRAYELGVNYFDTAVMYCHGDSQRAVGAAVKPFRDKILLSTKLPLYLVKESADFRRVLEESLTKLDTDYIDFYHFHGIDRAAYDTVIAPLHLMDEARRALDEGLIRHISFSFHDKPENMAYILDQGEIFSSVLMQYNLLDRANAAAMADARARGVGTVIMGPVAGGRLSAPTNLDQKLLGKRGMATPELAMRFVLGNPNVCCALSGMSSMEMVEQNAAIASLEEPMTPADHERADQMMEELKRFSDLYCTGCAYCMPCPAGIKIPDIFSAYTYYNVYGLTDHARHLYAKQEVKPDACLGCHACEKKCPQHIAIPDMLKKAETMLS